MASIEAPQKCVFKEGWGLRADAVMHGEARTFEKSTTPLRSFRVHAELKVSCNLV